MDSDISNWIIKKDINGNTCYYNKRENKSTWVKPDCLIDGKRKCDWVKYKNAEGNEYYYNIKLKKSVWKRPADFIDEDEDNKLELIENKVENTENKDDKIKKYLSFLREHGINYDWKWTRVEEYLKNKDGFYIINSVSERKKIFKEYAELEKIKEKKKKMINIKKKKEEFRQLLKENNNITLNTTLLSLNGIYYKEPRWKALDNNERMEIFSSYMNELFEIEQVNNKLLIKKQCDDLYNILLNHKDITANTTWNEACNIMKNNLIWMDLHEYHRLETFINLIKKLQNIEYEIENKKNQEKDKNHRITFHKMIKNDIKNDIITIKKKWKRYFKLIKNEDALYNILGQKYSIPYEIYFDYKEKLLETHIFIKNQFKLLLNSHINEFYNCHNNIISFQNLLKDYPPFSNFEDLNTNSFDYYSNYLFHKYNSRIIKSKYKFIDFVNNNYKKNMNYEDLIIENNKYFDSLPEKKKLKIFKKYIFYFINNKINTFLNKYKLDKKCSQNRKRSYDNINNNSIENNIDDLNDEKTMPWFIKN